MERVWATIVEGEGLTLSTFLNGLATTSSRAVKIDMAHWLRSSSAGDLLQRWQGADDWAVRRVCELVSVEGRKASGSAAFQQRPGQVSNEALGRFDLQALAEAAEAQLPVTTAVLGALGGIDDASPSSGSTPKVNAIGSLFFLIICRLMR